MDRIAVYRRQPDFFVVQENCLGDDRSRCDNMPVGQNQATLCIDDKAGRLA